MVLKTALEERNKAVTDLFLTLDPETFEEIIDRLIRLRRHDKDEFSFLLGKFDELKELMQRNIDFKTQARQDLQTAEEEALKPIRAKLNETLASIAREFGFALIINIDTNACPFIDPTMGKNIQELVTEYLNKK
jgi:Skp family chaperone for outer membrane proteins